MAAAYDPYAGVEAEATGGAPELRESDAEVLQQTREWVEGIIVDMKVWAARRTHCYSPAGRSASLPCPL